MNHTAKIIMILFGLLGLQGIAQQQVRVDAVLDTSRIRIGEQAHVDIYVNYDAKNTGIEILWPEIGDTLSGKVEVISVSPIDTTLPEKTNSTRIFQHQQITVSVYYSGYYAIPGFKFIVNGDTASPQFTSPLFLQVHTVPTDTSALKLKDIKPPFNEPFSWKWYRSYMYGGLGILVLAAIVIFLFRRYRRRQSVQQAEPEIPAVPAHITALASLEKIRQEAVWKDGKVKEYYSAISDTVRLYIEERFKVNALESTTDEIMAAFRLLVVDEESKMKLRQLLMLSDLVKFAKETPVETGHKLTLDNAFDFVNGTKREEEIVIPETPAVNNRPLD